MARQQDEEIPGKAYDARLVRRLLTYVGPYRGSLCLSVALLCVASALQILQPYLIKVAIDSHITPGQLTGLWGLALLFLAVLTAEGIIRYLQLYLMQWTGQRIMYDLRMEIFGHLHRLPLRYFDRNPGGRILTRVTSDVENLHELFTSGLVSAVGDVFMAGGIFAAMLILDFQLTLVAFAILPLLWFAVVLFQQKARGAYRLIRIKQSRLNAFLQEGLSGMSVIQALTQERGASRRFAAVSGEYRDAMVQSILYYAVFYPAVEVIAAAGLALIVWYGGGEVIQGALTLGVMVAFIEYLQRFFAPIKDLSEKYNIMQAAMASAERIFELLDTPPEVEGGKGRQVTRLKGGIEFRRVWFGYRPGEPVLKDLSFRVQPGERVALVGPTGAGKSTVVSLLNRLYEVERGAIVVDGFDIRDLDPESLRRRIGIILQDPFLFSESIGANLQVGDGISQERVERALRLTKATDFIARLPRGLETRLADRGSSLSGGERQLICFARALAYDPDILILDEATSNIDPETEAALQETLDKIANGRTTLIIAHRLRSTASADRILVLHRGALVEEGTHAALLARDGIYARLWRLQTDGHPFMGR
jgi:ATP-binding cassette subfamily B protein